MLNSSGDLLKIQANNGTIYWSLNLISSISDETDFFKSSDIVIKDNDIILSTSSSIFSINLNNGNVNWEQNADSKNIPIIDGNNIFLVTDNGYFVNLDKSSGKIVVKINPRYFRPTEVDLLIGDSSKAKTNLGWVPKVTFAELVKIMVTADYNKQKERHEKK